MRTVDATFQNLDSSEISLTDVSHYFDSDPTKLVRLPPPPPPNPKPQRVVCTSAADTSTVRVTFGVLFCLPSPAAQRQRSHYLTCC